MAEAKPVFVCVARAGLVVPTPEGGPLTLREGDEVEGDYYEQVAERTAGLVRKSEMSASLLETMERRRKARDPKAFPEQYKEAMQRSEPAIESPLDKRRRGAVENFRGAVQDAMGEARNPEDAKGKSSNAGDSKES